MAAEIEIKLALPAQAHKAFTRHPLLLQAGAPHERMLLNRYYDTPALALQEKRVALRVRKQGNQWLQTIKCEGSNAGGISIRPEWEHPYNGHFDFSPVSDPSLRNWLEEIERSGELQPVFETNFRRLAWQLRPADDTVIEVVLDHGWIIAGKQREEIAEVEIEQASGDIVHLFSIARHLLNDFDFLPAPYSKAERGYRLYTQAKPQPLLLTALPLNAAQDTQQAFRAILARFLDQLQRNYIEALHSDDPEFIHQARVAIRRLQTTLKLFAPLFPAFTIQKLRADLRRLKTELGRTRELDVILHEIVEPLLGGKTSAPGLQALHQTLQHSQKHSRKELLASLGDHKVAHLLLELAALMQLPMPDVELGIEAHLGDFVYARLNKLRKRVERYDHIEDDAEPEKLHAARIAVKHWRYANWIFSSLVGERCYKQTEKFLATLQGDLGCIQDLITAGETLAQHLPADETAAQLLRHIGNWHRARYGKALQASLTALHEIRTLPVPQLTLRAP